MQLPRRFQVHPKVRLLLLVARYQILERYRGIGIEDIVDWCFVEHSDAQRVCILHLVYERLVPDRIEGFLFDAGSIWLEREEECKEECEIRFTAATTAMLSRTRPTV